jgi:NitT/TauT family transport system substrate-binding protein/putative hydroxymethylpyrimidine transport system substrate-binding protein
VGVSIGRRRRAWGALLLAISAVALLAAVGVGSAGAKSERSGVSPRKLTLMLDFIPSPYHIGIYQAVKAGYYKQKNIDLKIIQPTSAGDYARLVSAGKADVGMADAVDLLTFVGKGTKYRGFLATLQRPLAGLAVLKKSNITSPGQLVGRKVASPGSPSNKAFLFAMVKRAGGDPNKVKLVTTGFDFAKYLVAGKIDGFTGYWTDAIEASVSSHVPLRFMRIDRFGGPRYPSLLFYATQDRISKDPSLIRDFAAATAHGYNDMVRSPSKALSAFLSQNRSVKSAPTKTALQMILPLFKAGTSRYGHISTGDLTKLSKFLVKYKLLKKGVQPSQAVTNQFVP